MKLEANLQLVKDLLTMSVNISDMAKKAAEDLLKTLEELEVR